MRFSIRTLLTATVAASLTAGSFAGNAPLNLTKKKLDLSKLNASAGNGSGGSSQGSSQVPQIKTFTPRAGNGNLGGLSGIKASDLTKSGNKSSNKTGNGTLGTFNPILNNNGLGVTKTGKFPTILTRPAADNSAAGSGLNGGKFTDLIKKKPGVVFPIDPGLGIGPSGGNGGNNPPADPGSNPPSVDPNPPQGGQGGNNNPPHDDHGNHNGNCWPQGCKPWWPKQNCHNHCHTYPSCVTTIWYPSLDPSVLVTNPVVVGDVNRLKLVVGQPAELSLTNLLSTPAAAALEVNGIGLPVSVTGFNAGLTQIAVPLMGLSQPTPARLFVFDGEMRPLAELDVLLMAAAL